MRGLGTGSTRRAAHGPFRARSVRAKGAPADDKWEMLPPCLGIHPALAGAGDEGLPAQAQADVLTTAESRSPPRARPHQRPRLCQGPPNVIALGPGKGIAGFGAAAVGWVGGSAQRPWDRAMRSRGALRGGLLCWVLGGLSFGGALGAVGRAVHDDDVGVVQQAVHGGGSEQSVAEEGAPLGGGAI